MPEKRSDCAQKSEITKQNEALRGNVSISLREVLLIVSFATGFAWVLFILFGRIAILNSRDYFDLRQYMALAMLMGLLFCLVLTGFKPRFVAALVSRLLFMISGAVLSALFGVLIFQQSELTLVWNVVLLVTSLIAGLILGGLFVVFVNGLVLLATTRVMLISVLGVSIAIVLYLLLENLHEPVALVAALLLPITACMSGRFVLSIASHGNNPRQNRNKAIGAEDQYARMTLRDSLNGHEKSSTNTLLLSMASIMGIREKSLGLFVYGFTTGTAAGVLMQTMAETPFIGSISSWTVFGAEAILVACLLASTLKLFSVRNYLRLPQWSYYLITVISFLFIINDSGLMRLVFSGLNVAAAIYFFTVDITVLYRMGQDMKLDPCINFAWYESIYVAAIVIGWVLFLALRQLLPGDSGTVVAASVAIAFVAAMMSLMRWIYYDSVSKNSSVTSSGEWKHRCAKMGKRYNLTHREIEILEYLVRGRSMNYIKDQFVISLSTVKTHVNNVYRKVGVHSREQLIGLFEQSRNRKSL